MIEGLDRRNIHAVKSQVNPEIHKTKEAQQLKESCQQFESILWAKLWKDMRNSAMSISGSDQGRPWKQMEDLSMEMASDDLVESSGGAGLWKMLYDSMIGHVAAEHESKARQAADAEAEGLAENVSFDAKA